MLRNQGMGYWIEGFKTSSVPVMFLLFTEIRILELKEREKLLMINKQFRNTSATMYKKKAAVLCFYGQNFFRLRTFYFKTYNF